MHEGTCRKWESIMGASNHADLPITKNDESGAGVRTPTFGVDDGNEGME